MTGVLLYLVENILQLVLRQSAAFHIFNRTELLCHPLAIFPPNRGHLLLGKLFPDARIVSQIDLGSDNEARNAGTVVVNLGKPLLSYVLEGGGRCDTEADEEHVGLRV